VVPFLSTCQLSRAATTPAPSLSLPLSLSLSLSLFLCLSPSLSPRYSITNSTVPVLARYSEPPDRPLSAAAAAGGTSVTQNERKVEVAIDVVYEHDGYARTFPPRRFHECIDRSSGVPFRFLLAEGLRGCSFDRRAPGLRVIDRDRESTRTDRDYELYLPPLLSLSLSRSSDLYSRDLYVRWICIPKRSRNE